MNEEPAGLLPGLVELLRAPLDEPEQVVLTSGVDLAVALTGSRIGYVHYVNDDDDTLELGTWSTSTSGFCTAVFDRHYPLSVAGVWADTARTRGPQVHNDYPSVPDRRGLPDGHAPVRRHLGVCALDGAGLPRVLLGVGNKESDYDSDDVSVAQQVVDAIWVVVSRNRAHQHVAARLALLAERQESARVCTWEWDPVTGRVSWDSSTGQLFGVELGGAAGTWDWLLDALHPAYRRHLRAALDKGPDGGPLDLELRGQYEDGRPITARLRGGWVVRPQGHDHLLRGTLLDLSLQAEADRARYEARHDPVTGLLNRAGLIEGLEDRLTRWRRRPGEGIAVHFVDLDGFRTVNDESGYNVGDEVLATIARRLAATVRGDDMCARLGGDEFIVVQTGRTDVPTVEGLAQRLLDAVATPVPTRDGFITLSACAGVAIARQPVRSAALLDEADRALHRARRDSPGSFVIAE